MTKNTKSKACLAAFVGGVLNANIAHADIDVTESFQPYANGFPSVEGVTPGLIINSSNADQYKDVFDDRTWEFVKAGDYEIEVAPTIDFILNQKYIDASKKNDSVGFDEKGNLTNYINGRPFPYPPSANDPQAGVKLIWNFQYGQVWSDLGCLQPWYWQYKDFRTGSLERTIKFDRICFQRKAFRTVYEPIPEILPNPDQIYRAIYLRVVEPFDLKDTQLLLHKYKDDTKRTNGWLYLGFQRRVRRLATGQTTDAFLGSDIMIEDFEGFNGRVSDFNWEYLGTKTLLMSMWDHNAIKEKGEEYVNPENGFEYVDYTGKGKCFPKAPWMLRKMYLLKGTPKDPSHPVSHRIHYIDAQTNDMPMMHVYDRKGEFWKWFNIGWPHPDHHLPQNKGTGAMLGDSASLIDVQAQHCTTVHFHGVVGPDIIDETLFQVQNLRASAN